MGYLMNTLTYPKGYRSESVMTSSLTSPEHLADVKRVKQAVRDARARSQYERVVVNMTTTESVDVENPEICNFYLPVEKLGQLKAALQDEVFKHICGGVGDLLEQYGVRPEKIIMVGVVNIAIYVGTYVKASWDKWLVGEEVEHDVWSNKTDNFK